MVLKAKNTSYDYNHMNSTNSTNRPYELYKPCELYEHFSTISHKILEHKPFFPQKICLQPPISIYSLLRECENCLELL